MEALRLASLAQLHALSFDDLGRLARQAGELRVPAGGRLLLGGSLHHELAFVAAGRGVVRCAGETVAELGPGDAFGALTAERLVYGTATVGAIEALHLVVFSARALRRMRAEAPGAVDALMVACAQDPGERSRALAGPRPAPALKLVPAAA
jgi:CRP-like cAMP-binding protein